jgi:hypothetical protein
MPSKRLLRSRSTFPFKNRTLIKSGKSISSHPPDGTFTDVFLVSLHRAEKGLWSRFAFGSRDCDEFREIRGHDVVVHPKSETRIDIRDVRRHQDRRNDPNGTALLGIHFNAFRLASFPSVLLSPHTLFHSSHESGVALDRCLEQPLPIMAGLRGKCVFMNLFLSIL